MPLFSIIKQDDAWGAVWKIDESVEELAALHPCGDELLSGARKRYTSSTRQLEFMAVRVLLFALLDRYEPLTYLPSGRPILVSGNQYISISHTRGYAAVLLSTQCEVGIDIEQYGERIQRLKSRIIGPLEQADTTYELLLHWSAKETAFKIIDCNGIDFCEHLQVAHLNCTASTLNPFDEGHFELYYTLKTSEKGVFRIDYYTTPDYVLTYAKRKVLC